MINHTQIMGILNITPDSFSDGGEFLKLDDALTQAREMIMQGADIIDIGGESFRPHAQAVDPQEEIKRILPILTAIHQQFKTKVRLSVDTYKSEVAEAALQNEATIINNLGGMQYDPKMAEVVVKYRCPIIFYHTTALPDQMMEKPILKDVIEELQTFFTQRISFALQKGVKKEQIILDPGIGFGKSLDQNLEIIRRFDELRALEYPLVIGVSRKGHLGKLLNEADPKKRLEGALAETAVAVLKGATIVRTHDVLQTKKFLTVLDQLLSGFDD